MKTLLTNARIWNGRDEGLVDGRDVLIENGRILEIGRVRAKADETIDMAGRFLMPGLIDAHFHAYWGPANVTLLDQLPMTYLAHHARHLLENALKRGFTTIRDAGGADWSLGRATEEGLIEGPRLFYAGRAISQTGGHGDGRHAHTSTEYCSCRFLGALSEVADGTDAVRLAARETLRRGASQVKLFLSGGVISPTDPIHMPQYSDAEISAAVEEAASRGAYVMAHAYTADSAERSARLGIRSVEHGNLIDEAAARAMAKAGTFLVPTLITYDVLLRQGDALGLTSDQKRKVEEVAGAGIEACRLARLAGVKIGFGTDLAGPMHAQQRDEFRLRAEADRPIDVLRSATSVNAELLQRSSELGVIAPGAHADMIAVDGDPREDLSTLFAVPALPFVMRGGKVVVSR
ncbi:MAG: amidohydrolase family protein [Alphaproteobacteria bacterium]